MGRILYGVMGDAGGHVMEALTLATQMPQHEFLFLGGGKVASLRDSGYCVEPLPMLSTFYRNNKVDIVATASNAVRTILTSRKIRHRAQDIIKDFDPDLILTNYEYFTPIAALSMNRSCVSLDHQHILTHCRYDPPTRERLNRFMTRFSVRYLYSNCSKFLIVSFFNLPPVNPETTVVLAPIVRSAVKKAIPRDGEHVLVYQTSPTFHKLFPVLKEIDTPFVIYGFGAKPPDNNLFFKAYSVDGFVEDLAGSRYVIVNGGHNVICEALHLGKPVLSFPIADAYEQFLNAYFIDKYGFGAFSTSLNFSKDLFEGFESRVNEFKSNIINFHFAENDGLVALLEQMVSCKESRTDSPLSLSTYKDLSQQ
jgi:uncharacterized protein (TIGR00661 family)